MDPDAATVLIVDDEPLNVDLLEQELGAAGYRTLSAASGEEALASVAKTPPDLILLDVVMKGVDGYETCRRLRAMPSEKGLIIIALTGWGQSADREQTSAAGFDAHLVKPVDPENVLALINLLGQNNTLPA